MTQRALRHVSLSAETDPNDPAKAVFTVTLAGDETFQTKWLDWSKNESAPKVTAVLDGDPAQKAELHLDVSGTGSSQKYILTGTMDLPNVSADTVHTAEIYYNGSLYYGACASFTQTPVTLAGTDAYTISVSGGWPSGIEQTVFMQDAQVPVLAFTDNKTGYTYYDAAGADVRQCLVEINNSLAHPFLGRLQIMIDIVHIENSVLLRIIFFLVLSLV